MIKMRLKTLRTLAVVLCAILPTCLFAADKPAPTAGLRDGLAAKVRVDPTKKVLSEADLGGDLTAKGGKLKGFTLAGEDKKFVPAKAEIVGDTVIVSSDQVAQPVAVRYLWCRWPELWTDTTLYNKNGLPAPPFRSDSWIR